MAPQRTAHELKEKLIERAIFRHPEKCMVYGLPSNSIEELSEFDPNKMNAEFNSPIIPADENLDLAVEEDLEEMEKMKVVEDTIMSMNQRPDYYPIMKAVIELLDEEMKIFQLGPEIILSKKAEAIARARILSKISYFKDKLGPLEDKKSTYDYHILLQTLVKGDGRYENVTSLYMLFANRFYAVMQTLKDSTVHSIIPPIQLTHSQLNVDDDDDDLTEATPGHTLTIRHKNNHSGSDTAAAHTQDSLVVDMLAVQPPKSDPTNSSPDPPPSGMAGASDAAESPRESPKGAKTEFFNYIEHPEAQLEHFLERYGEIWPVTIELPNKVERGYTLQHGPWVYHICKVDNEKSPVKKEWHSLDNEASFRKMVDLLKLEKSKHPTEKPQVLIQHSLDKAAVDQVKGFQYAEDKANRQAEHEHKKQMRMEGWTDEEIGRPWMEWLAEECEKLKQEDKTKRRN